MKNCFKDWNQSSFFTSLYYRMLLAVLFACLATAAAAPIRVGNHWSGGFEGFFTVHADHAVTGWKAHLRFDSPVDSIEVNANKYMSDFQVSYLLSCPVLPAKYDSEVIFVYKVIRDL